MSPKVQALLKMLRGVCLSFRPFLVPHRGPTGSRKRLLSRWGGVEGVGEAGHSGHFRKNHFCSAVLCRVIGWQPPEQRRFYTLWSADPDASCVCVGVCRRAHVCTCGFLFFPRMREVGGRARECGGECKKIENERE